MNKLQQHSTAYLKRSNKTTTATGGFVSACFAPGHLRREDLREEIDDQKRRAKLMFSRKPIQFLIFALALASRFFAPASARAQQNQVMEELQFSGVTNVEKNSGVWIDEQNVGYLKELKGDKKIMLLPGEHEISVRQAGYKDFTSKIIVEPGQVKLFRVTMEKNLRAQYPGSDAATLKLNIIPERAAVFLDDGYVGHASDFGGTFHSMLVSPGRHRIKIELPGSLVLS